MHRPTTPEQASGLLIRRVRLGPAEGSVDVLIRNGVIASIEPSRGHSGPAGGHSGPTGRAEVFDGLDGFLLPGLRDAHVHFTQWAIAQQRVDLSPARSAAAAAQLMVDARDASGRAPTDLLSGFGFRAALWSDEPHKNLLQHLLPDVPAVLVSQDLHSAWFSPAALRLVGVDHPTGLLREADCFAALAGLPEAERDQIDRWALAAAERAVALGVTAITDFEFADTTTDWRRRAASAGRLPFRVQAAIRPGGMAEAIDRGQRTGDPITDTESLVTVGPCKVLMDGSLNTRTALCHDPYPGIGDPTQANGLLTQDPDDLVRMMKLGARHGLRYAVHAIGDRANTLALDCFQAAGVGGRIEHAQLVDPADLPRFASLGVLAGVQPAHAVEDRDVADVQWRGRTDRAFPYASLLAAGAALEFGSDAPVSRLDPWHAIAAAVTRTTGDRPPWHGEQALTLTDALAASTSGHVAPAVGDLADLVVLAHHPSTLAAHELSGIPVLATIVAGRISHRTQ
jgi:predicted amidohydrolase YtcJ